MRFATSTLLVALCTGVFTSACVSLTPAIALSGVAATGGPLRDAQVVVRDSRGNTVTAQADAQGRYSVDVSTLIAPVVVSATEADADQEHCLQSRVPRPVCMVALLEALRVGVNTANVNPLTDWVASDVALQLGLMGPHFAPPAFSSLGGVSFSFAAALALAGLARSFAAFAFAFHAAVFSHVRKVFRLRELLVQVVLPLRVGVRALAVRIRAALLVHGVHLHVLPAPELGDAVLVRKR